MEDQQTTVGKVLDVLNGTTKPEFDFNISVENDTILKIVVGAIAAGLVIIILNRIAVRLL